MTSRITKPDERVTLSRKDVDFILRHQMGWEPVDVRSFWRLARQLQQGGQR